MQLHLTPGAIMVENDRCLLERKDQVRVFTIIMLFFNH